MAEITGTEIGLVQNPDQAASTTPKTGFKNKILGLFSNPKANEATKLDQENNNLIHPTIDQINEMSKMDPHPADAGLTGNISPLRENPGVASYIVNEGKDDQPLENANTNSKLITEEANSEETKPLAKLEINTKVEGEFGSNLHVKKPLSGLHFTNNSDFVKRVTEANPQPTQDSQVKQESPVAV